MRTTINFQDSTMSALTNFLQTYEAAFGRRVSPSDFVDEAVRVHVLRAVDRLPRPDETVEAMLLRRAAEIRTRIDAPTLAAQEVEDLMREATALHGDCEAAFLRRGNVTAASFLDAYKRTSAAALGAYNLGAMRMNNGTYVFPVRACPTDGGGEVWVRVHRSAVGYGRVTGNLLKPDEAATGVHLGRATAEPGDWTAFQLLVEPPRNPAGIQGLVEHLVYPLKIAWEKP